MRSDYVLYTIAVIFFILTTVAAMALEEQRELSIITTAVLGLLFIGLGYSQRPRAVAMTTETPLTPSVPSTITKEAEPEAEVAPSGRELTKVRGIGEKRKEQLKSVGVDTVKELSEASAKNLATKLEISQKLAKRWIQDAKKLAGE